MSHEAIDRYIDAIFTRYQTALRDEVATLREPSIDDVDRTCRRLGCMIETLTAFAIGHAVGRVVEAMRRIDGTLAELIGRAAIGRAAIGRALSETGAPVASPSLLPPLHFVADRARRPLVDQLAAQLHQRLCLAARHARILVRAVATTVARHSPLHSPALLAALDLLAGDPAAAFAFGDQLALGWRFFLALVTGEADPELADEPRWQRGRALWSAWSRRMRGVSSAPAREFILRVA